MENKTSLDRALEILFSFRNKSLKSIQEINEDLHIPKSSCYRYVKKLCTKGLLEYDMYSNKYKLGMKIFQLSSIVNRQMGIGENALPFMQELFRLTRESIFLVVKTGDIGICIEKIDGDSMLRIVVERGDIIPMHAGAAGKVLMAYLPKKEQDEIIQKRGLRKFTPKTIISLRILKEELKKIRQRGYAYSDQELHEGARALAAPIFDIYGNVIASIAIAGAAHRVRDSQIKKYKKFIVEIAGKCSAHLGNK
jgi:IclR family transcriptional regulator, KDG regulon repressor